MKKHISNYNTIFEEFGSAALTEIQNKYSKFFLTVKECFLIFFFIFLPISQTFASGITLPKWISDNMMLPSGVPFKLSGSSEPGQLLSIQFEQYKLETMADASGGWKIDFPSVKQGITSDMVFTCGSEKMVINNIVTGDIWLCSGQSNMQRTVAHTDEALEAVEDVRDLDIRYFDGTSWKKVTSENVKSISAVSIYFAIEMAKKQNKAVGIFVAAKGGTSIDAWLPGEVFPDTETGNIRRSLINDPEVLKAAEEDRIDFKPAGQQRLARWGLGRAVPASLYSTLILPYSDLPVRGVVWYQGENNAGSIEQAKEYHLWLNILINEYRRLWGNPELLFVIIQLPSYDPGTKEGRIGWSIVQGRQARVVRQTKHTELVKIKDLGDLKDIHPRRKKEVGERAADAALKLTHSE